jgi:hypothetical protein
MGWVDSTLPLYLGTWSIHVYKDQHGFRPGYSCDRHIVTICKDIANFLYEGARINAIIIEFSKAFDLVLCDRLLTQTAASGVDSRVAAWVWEFLLRRSQRFSLGGKLSD